MATIREQVSSSGEISYKITISRGASKSQISRTFHPEPTWSAKTRKRELDKFVRNFESQVESGELVSRTEKKQAEREKEIEAEQHLTVSRFVERYFMPSICSHCAQNTIEGYGQLLKIWILPSLGDIRISEVASGTINLLLLDMVQKGKSHATVQKVEIVCNSIFKLAFLNGVIENNPMCKVILPRESKDSSKKVIAYDLEETRLILSSLTNESLFWQSFVRLLLETGIRRGECLGLQWQDIDFSTGEIRISRSLNYSAKIGFYTGTPKNGKCRTVYISNQLIELIKRFKSDQTITGLYIFTKNGQLVTPDAVTQHFKRFGKKIGLPDFHPHKLRHTCASLAVQAGCDVASIAELLGHRDAETTLRLYVNSNDESRKKAASIIQAVINE